MGSSIEKQIESGARHLLQLKYTHTCGVSAFNVESVFCCAAREEGSTSLNLDNRGLKKVPQEVFQLVKLTELGLHDNNLTTLPSEIACLTQLSTLWLEQNKLRQLPDSFGKLCSLRKLWLR